MRIYISLEVHTRWKAKDAGVSREAAQHLIKAIENWEIFGVRGGLTNHLLPTDVGHSSSDTYVRVCELRPNKNMLYMLGMLSTNVLSILDKSPHL